MPISEFHDLCNWCIWHGGLQPGWYFIGVRGLSNMIGKLDFIQLRKHGRILDLCLLVTEIQGALWLKLTSWWLIHIVINITGSILVLVQTLSVVRLIPRRYWLRKLRLIVGFYSIQVCQFGLWGFDFLSLTWWLLWIPLKWAISLHQNIPIENALKKGHLNWITYSVLLIVRVICISTRISVGKVRE